MSISWAEWLESAVSRSTLPFNIRTAPQSAKRRATEFVEVVDGDTKYSVPIIGGYSELEVWLLNVCTLNCQKVSTLFALKKAQIIDKCVTEAEIDAEGVKAAQSDLLTLLSGGIPESYKILQWATENAEALAELVSEDYLAAERIAQFERAGVLMATRIDPEVDWLELILNSPSNLLGQVTEILQRESGLFDLIEDTPDPKH